MKQQSVFFVGTQEEIAHHVAPVFDSELAKKYSLQILSPAEVESKASPGDLAVFYSEHFERFRNCCTELKKRNVATLYMVDGILEFRNAWDNRPDEPACPFTMRPVLSHKVACIGPSQARTLSSWGNHSKVEIVGIPRFDPIKSVEWPKTIKEEFRILVMTAKCPGFTQEQVEITAQSLLDLKHWFESKGRMTDREIVPIWRLTGNLAEEIGVENQLSELTGLDLLRTLQACDAVISTSSTAMLEAMMTNKPVAVLDYHNTPKYVRAAWQINAQCQIAGVVNQLFEPSPARQQFQKLILQDALLLNCSATNRLALLITQMLESAAVQLADDGAELSFGPNLLEPVEQSSDWNQAAMFPAFDEFQNGDLVELQAQLAHTRREIEFLNRELAQVRSELGEAHTIFEQIHQHPIAGPIVRARQKMRDWFEKARRSLGRRRSKTFSDAASTKQSVK